MGICGKKYTPSSKKELLQYSDVPKDLMGNLLWRAYLWQCLRTDRRMSRVIVESCANDPLFYINSFVWTLDPRKEQSVIPFISYGFQDELILRVLHNISESKKKKNRHRRYDVGIDKSRDMGVTWCAIITLDWLWRFGKNASFRCISRKEEYVDNPDDDDALFQKMDFIESRLPAELQVRGVNHDKNHGRTHLKIHNDRNRMTIVGESSNPNAGRGGRNLCALRDEEPFAENGNSITQALNQTTRCQIRIGTPNGTGNSFFLAKSRGKIDWLSLHWALHPEKAAGLYSIKNGKVQVIDHEWHDENPGYKFRIEPTYSDPGTPWEYLRSPWFDGECEAADSPLHIAQEIQLSYLNSGAPFFPIDTLELLRAKHQRDPSICGTLPELFGMLSAKAPHISDRDGRIDTVKCWIDFLGGKPPQDTTYSFGVDISAGTGASDSVIKIGADLSKAVVFEYRSNGISPEDLARLTNALADIFTTTQGKPYIAWDGGGHGGPFGTQLQMLNPALDVYYHQAVTESGSKRSKRAGVPQNRQIKIDMFTDFRTSLFSEDYSTPSKETYDQCQQFIFDGSGGVVHQKSKSTENKSDTGEQHGDAVTAEVILWLAMRERPEPVAAQKIIPYGSYAWRLRENRKREREEYSMFRAG